MEVGTARAAELPPSSEVIDERVAHRLKPGSNVSVYPM
jgi:hypothetical protein